MEHVCRICGSKKEAKEYYAKEMMYGTREVFRYFECPECGCLQIDEVPDNLGNYYSNNYYSFEKVQLPDIKAEVVSDKRILDVGCGAGHFLCRLALQGYANPIGCDPFIDKDTEYENGVRIYKKSIHEMGGEFDYVFMNDSFEHVTDPHEVMDSLHRLLSNQGVARITLPVYPNIAFDMFETSWFQLDAPRHIYLHSLKSMQYLAEKHGLRIERVEFNSNSSQIVRSFLYTKGIPFVEQNEDAICKYFSVASLKEIEQCSQEANEKRYGDHAIFFLMKA